MKSVIFFWIHFDHVEHNKWQFKYVCWFKANTSIAIVIILSMEDSDLLFSINSFDPF